MMMMMMIMIIVIIRGGQSYGTEKRGACVCIDNHGGWGKV